MALLPTDTVYGLAAALDRRPGVAALYALKGRPRVAAVPGARLLGGRCSTRRWPPLDARHPRRGARRCCRGPRPAWCPTRRAASPRRPASRGGRGRACARRGWTGRSRGSTCRWSPPAPTTPAGPTRRPPRRGPRRPARGRAPPWSTRGALPGTASAVVDLRAVAAGGPARARAPRPGAGGGRNARIARALAGAGCTLASERPRRPGVLRVSFIDDDSYLSQDIAEADPAVAAILPRGGRAPGRDAGDDRQRELHQPRGAAGGRARCSPTSTPRGSRAGATTAAARSSTRSEQLAIDRAKEVFGATTSTCSRTRARRPTRPPTRRSLQPGDRVLAMALAARRPPVARAQGQLLRPALRLPPLRRAPRGLPHRHGPGARHGARAAARADRRRRLRLPAHHRLPGLPRDRRRGGRALHGRHGAHRRPRRRRPAPVAGRHRRPRDHHHPQDPRRPARRHGDVQRGARHRRSTRPSSRASRAAR